jgi:hypothetical protein
MLCFQKCSKVEKKSSKFKIFPTACLLLHVHCSFAGMIKNLFAGGVREFATIRLC